MCFMEKSTRLNHCKPELTLYDRNETTVSILFSFFSFLFVCFMFFFSLKRNHSQVLSVINTYSYLFNDGMGLLKYKLFEAMKNETKLKSVKVKVKVSFRL